MPKLDPKIVQKDLETGRVAPLYWIYGGEAMKSRELVKRIKKTVLGEADDRPGFNEFVLDASEVDAHEVFDAAQSLSLGGGVRFVLVKNAHLLKDPEVFTSLMGPLGALSEVSSVVVFLSKDLDQRKKFSKILVEKAIVIACEEVADPDREPWIQYLAKRKGIQLSAQALAHLRGQDPWSLDLMDRELEKIELMQNEDALGGSTVLEGGTDEFLEAFFLRQKAQALPLIQNFADHPDQALPLLGLISWNTRMLSVMLKDQESGTLELKLGSFLVERFSRYARVWKLSEVAALQSQLYEIDFGMKQTQRIPLGLWSDLVFRFGN
jgi:DNA polymerase III delta subunit